MGMMAARKFDLSMLLQAVVLPWAIFICVAWLLSSSVATSVQFKDGQLICRLLGICGILQFEKDYNLGIDMI